MQRVYHRQCVICGNPFDSRAPGAKYCSICREKGFVAQIQREQYKKRYLKHRANICEKYRKGVIFICRECGRKYLVHERTLRSICTNCLKETHYGRELISNRKDIKEELVEE